jgi:hypothetical protein
MSLRGAALSGGIFAMAALVGPLMNWVSWPPDLLSEKRSFGSRFVEHLVYLLWPMQALGVIQYSAGILTAAIVAIGANVLVFGLIGLAVGAVSSRPAVVLGLYMLVATLVCLQALWDAGFNLSYLNPLAVVVVLVFHAFLFWLSSRFAT